MTAARGGARPRKHSLKIAGHRTSISLEDAFWTALRDIAREERRPLGEIVAEIDGARGASGLSSAIRVFVLSRYREKATAQHAQR
ncbi:MAG: ribbon-helix-helix domain-containing protein [Dichotomicrobium sp.]